jgi:hypothetical protein
MIPRYSVEQDVDDGYTYRFEDVPFSHIAEMRRWCEEHFGEPFPTWRTERLRGRWENDWSRRFRFRDERDAFHFRMRWG